MDFDFSDEQKQLRQAARRFFTEKSPPASVRTVLEGEAPYDRQLWQQLGEMGFLGAAIAEEFGGSGLGYLELCVIAEEAGRSLAAVPLSSSIYLGAELLKAAGTPEQKAQWLPLLASGERIATVALAEAFGREMLHNCAARVDDGRLSGTKILVPDGMIADLAIVSAAEIDGSALSLFLVDLSGSGVERKEVKTIDPTRPQARIDFSNVPAERLGDIGAGASLIARAYDRVAVLVAFEQVGGADQALEMARDYALERMAFGRQIGSFQAIKHMLADMYVSATLARSNAYYGAWALSEGAAELPVAAASARVSATYAFQHCAKNNIQVHGGMGFTWEFDCHLYYRRSNALALALGSLSSWEELLIDRMRENGDLAAAA